MQAKFIDRTRTAKADPKHAPGKHLYQLPTTYTETNVIEMLNCVERSMCVCVAAAGDDDDQSVFKERVKSEGKEW